MGYVLDYGSRKPLLFQALEHRRKTNKDSIVLIVGEKRSSKSYSAIKIAEKLSPTFNVDTNLFYSPRDFIVWMQKSENQVCILDEMSAAFADSRDWYSTQNRILNRVGQTQGFRKNIIIQTTPMLKEIDKRMQSYAHYVLVTMKPGLLKCFRLKNSQFQTKTFPMPFEFLTLGLPTKINIERYEKLKRAWNDKDLKEDLAFLDELEEKQDHVRVFKPAEYLKAFKLGLIDRESIFKRLKTMGYPKEDIEIMIRVAENTVKSQDAASKLRA